MITEAFIIGLKEGFKIGVIWLVFSSFLLDKKRQDLLKPFYIGLIFTLLISFSSFFIPLDLFRIGSISPIRPIIGYTFGLFYIASVGALYYSAGLNLFGPLHHLSKSNTFLWAVIFLTTIFFFSPDALGSSLFIKETAFMKGKAVETYISAMSGFISSTLILFVISRRFNTLWIGKLFSIAQILLFLSIVKLLGGGIKGFAELSLIPSVQRGLMKFFHDVVHQVLVMLMVPDHPLLKTTVWNFIGIFFGSNFTMMVALFLLLTPPVMFLYHSIVKPIPEPAGFVKGAEKRKFKALERSERRRKALPVIFFIFVILFTWFSQRGETVSRLYNPKPIPVVEDKGIILIPLSDPTMDLRDGRLHKFLLTLGEDSIRILIIKKPDNTLAVCLDACEICPPEGYGQSESHVICIYCNTPIPVETLGEPGGCNPIPLNASVTERNVRIELDEILKKWQYVKTGKSKEAVK